MAAFVHKLLRYGIEMRPRGLPTYQSILVGARSDLGSGVVRKHQVDAVLKVVEFGGRAAHGVADKDKTIKVGSFS